MKRLITASAFVCIMCQSCIYGGYKAEKEIVKLQEKLDKIHYMAEEFVIDDNIDSTEQDRIQSLLWAIEDESTYEEFDFYVPE